MSSVDVIVPCYRYGHFLRECVESVLTQSEVRVRVLIIDDASPDDTAKVGADLARRDPRVSFVRHSANKGHITTYNEGIEWASADYLLILSADDYLLPGALSRAANLMDAFPKVGFTFGRVIVRKEDGSRTHTRAGDGCADNPDWRLLRGLEFIELSGARDIVPTATAVVRTELQKRVGGYRPELPHAGDMEMWLRLAAHASVGMSRAYEAVYRRHAGNMSLDYTMETWLPDVQQRKAALDCFFQTCGSVLPSAEQLRRKLFFLLACDAVGYASAAFNECKIKASKQLCEYALELCPEVKGSFPWTKLAFKRCMGYRAWRLVQSAVAGIRQVTLPFKRMAKLVSSYV